MPNRYSCHQCGYWADVGGDGWATCPGCGGNDTEVTPNEPADPLPVAPAPSPATEEGGT